MLRLIGCLIGITLIFVGCKKSSQSKPQPLRTISPGMVHNLILQNKNNSSFHLVDVRTTKEYNEGHLENSININWLDSSSKELYKSISKTDTVVVYCRSGNRSHSAGKWLKKNGFHHVYNMEGGLLAWTIQFPTLSASPNQERK